VRVCVFVCVCVQEVSLSVPRAEKAKESDRENTSKGKRKQVCLHVLVWLAGLVVGRERVDVDVSVWVVF